MSDGNRAEATASRLDVALDLAANLGWPVFPLHSPITTSKEEADRRCSCKTPGCANVGKHPRTKHGFKDATTELAAIERLWKESPQGNIGIACGVHAGIVVVDIDPRHGGDVTLEGLEAEHGRLPATVETLTGGGGRHLFFQHPGGYIKSREIAAGIDCKADGGYVVAHGSLHGSGNQYAWRPSATPDDLALAPLPPWLLSLMRDEHSPAPTASGAEGRETGKIKAGRRNKALISLGGTMRRRGMCSSAIKAALHAENEAHCEPPLPATEVDEVAASASSYEPGDGDTGNAGRKSQATLLLELIESIDDVELFHDAEGEAYATVPVGDHRETMKIGARGFRDWAAHLFYVQYQKAPGAQGLQDALGTLSGRARFDGPERSVNVRIAQHDASIWFDLCDASWRAVRIGPEGWSVVSGAEVPVKFVRRPGMEALPTPVRGGSIDELRPLLNLPEEHQWTLIIGWLVAAFRPTGPYGVLSVSGEQGTAKSTLCKLLRRLIDPNAADLRRPPRDERDVFIAGKNSWVSAWNNVSGLRDHISDAACALATDGGFATRSLFTNEDETIFTTRRPVLLNGIDEPATRSDLVDRSIQVQLAPIPEERRLEEEVILSRFEAMWPRTLGALLDSVSAALRLKETICLDRKPRMADLAVWVTAAEQTLGWHSGRFMDAYMGSRADAHVEVVESSPVGPALLQLVNAGPFDGTATELLEAINKRIGDERPRGWPENARGMGSALRRLAPDLRAMGMVVELPKKGRGRAKRLEIHLEWVGSERPASTASSAPGAHDGHAEDLADHAGRPEHACSDVHLVGGDAQ